MQKTCSKTGRFLAHELIVGAVHNKWTVIGYSHKSKVGNIFWECKCECGSIRKVAGHAVISGKSKSCGCNRFSKDINKKHGLRYHPLYKVWRGMRERCLNTKSKKYPDYGGRGIDMCNSWKESVVNFYNDMIEGYEKGLHLDRRDNNQGYSKDNCRWVKPIVNANNKRSNVYICMDGRTHTPAEWGRELGVKDDTINHRRNRGWTDFEALFGLGKQ